MGERHVDAMFAEQFLPTLEDESAAAIITSPPYSGLPGRAETEHVLHALLHEAPRVLLPGGSLLLVVGATRRRPLLPFEIITDIARNWNDTLQVAQWHVWKRPAVSARRIGYVNCETDFIIQVSRHDRMVPPIHLSTHVQTSMIGFDYGKGVTMPSDLAALLVSKTTSEGDLVVDPFAGLGEVGVQAVAQGRRFAGCDADDWYAGIANDRIANAAERTA